MLISGVILERVNVFIPVAGTFQLLTCWGQDFNDLWPKVVIVHRQNKWHLVQIWTESCEDMIDIAEVVKTLKCNYLGMFKLLTLDASHSTDL